MHSKVFLGLIASVLMIIGVGCATFLSNTASTPLEQTLSALTETREAINLTTTYHGTQGYPLPTMTYPGACIGIKAYCTEEYLRDFAVMATRFEFQATYAVQTATAQATSKPLN